MELHDLTAGYALDALDDDERERYERHLAECDRCRDELAGFQDVSAALAVAADGPEPPPSLRDRILEEARAGRSNVVPLRRRLDPRVLSFAAAAALALVAVGVWSTSLGDGLRDGGEHAVLDDPSARTVPTAGGEADLVVTAGGDAALVVRTLPPAPAGMDYEIWVIEGGVPRRAGLFERPGVTLLTRPVEKGQTVAVTLERDGGVDRPTGDPLFTADTA